MVNPYGNRKGKVGVVQVRWTRLSRKVQKTLYRDPENNVKKNLWGPGTRDYKLHFWNITRTPTAFQANHSLGMLPLPLGQLKLK